MKTYLIVGGSSGVGFSIVEHLKKEGHHIIVLSRTKNDLTNVVHHEVDITEDTPSFPVIDGAIDGLVYCPGSINLKPFKGLKPKLFYDEWNLNLLGAVKTIQKYTPNLKKAGKASIVMFSTVAVQHGMRFHASIAAAKGAVEGLTRSLAAEFAPKIRVNAVAPSLTDTPLASKLLNTEVKKKNSADRHPLKRVGEANDVAQAALFLLKDESDWMTGQILKVDGGYSSIISI